MSQRSPVLIARKLIIRLAAKRSYVRTAVLSSFCLLFTYLSLSEPDIEWDIVPYVANATQYLYDQPIEELHQSIYRDMRESISADDFANLTGSPSRAVLSKDPEAFKQTIKFFYDARIVYTGILAGFIKIGVNPFFATYFISAICAILSILLLSRLIPIQLPMGLCFALPFIALSCGILNVSRLASPDALATLVTIVLYWLLIRNRLYMLLLLLPLIIFVRTDLILLAALFVAYLLLVSRVPRFLVAVSGLSTIAAYLILNYVIVDSDPWSSLIGYNFGEKPTHPAEYSFQITVSDYTSFIVQGLKSFSYNPMFFMFCALSITGVFLFSSRFFYNPARKPVSQQHLDLLFLHVSSVTYIGLHFLMFPVTWTRFFAAQYSLVTVVVIWATLSILAERNYSDRTEVDILNN